MKIEVIDRGVNQLTDEVSVHFKVSFGRAEIVTYDGDAAWKMLANMDTRATPEYALTALLAIARGAKK